MLFLLGLVSGRCLAFPLGSMSNMCKEEHGETVMYREEKGLWGSWACDRSHHLTVPKTVLLWVKTIESHVQRVEETQSQGQQENYTSQPSSNYNHTIKKATHRGKKAFSETEGPCGPASSTNQGEMLCPVKVFFKL